MRCPARPPVRPSVVDAAAPTRHITSQRIGERAASIQAPAAPVGLGAAARDFAQIPVRVSHRKSGEALQAAQREVEFPHRSRIEQGLARTIPGRAVIDNDACRRIGVPAFTDRNVVSFADDRPSLRVAAHEAVHLLQHGGATRDGGLGAEGHADLVAQAIEQNVASRHLVGHVGAVVDVGVRSYTEIPVATQKPGEWDAGGDLRLSDDTRMAVRQDEPQGGHNAWATSAVITSANTKLAAAGSVLKLTASGGTLKGKSPKGFEQALNKVEPENTATKTKGATMELWADCGRAARDVMGAGKGTGGGPMVATFRAGGKDMTTAVGGPEAMKDEVMQQLMGAATAADAWSKYFKLSAAERRKIDEKAGINKFAKPGVGQGYTMSSGGADYPGMAANTWNFHWAGVVMESGGDRVTLENYATGVPGEKNTQWDFQMYGSAAKSGQTFFEQHKATKQHGQQPTAMAVQKS
jgi:hypothetical protein